MAFVLLTLVLATSFQVFSTGMQRAGDLEDYARALAVAQSQLAESGVGDTFVQGQTAGQSDDGRFRWTLAISQFDDGTDPSKQVLASFYSVRMAVRVAWQSGSGQERHLDLATLVVGRAD